MFLVSLINHLSYKIQKSHTQCNYTEKKKKQIKNADSGQLNYVLPIHRKEIPIPKE